MRVFVAGATGVVGHRAVTALRLAGHEVSGVARSAAKAALLTDLGARPVELDVFDATAVRRAVAAHDAVCNLATHIPRLRRAALPGAWADNDRLRTEASRNLVDAALAAGAARYVQESVTFGYRDSGAEWIDEGADYVLAPFAGSVEAAETEAARFTSTGGAGVVLRFASFYSADSHHTVDGIRAARRRLVMQAGAPDAYLSSIHADDAASAVVAALAVAAGTYNVGDDDPVTRTEYAQILAHAVGVRRAHLLPRLATKAGGSKAEMLARSQRISNAKLVGTGTWVPSVPSIRQGLPAVAQILTGAEA